MTNNEGQFHYFYIPFILFIYLAVFAITGYIFEINLGNDDIIGSTASVGIRFRL